MADKNCPGDFLAGSDDRSRLLSDSGQFGALGRLAPPWAGRPTPPCGPWPKFPRLCGNGLMPGKGMPSPVRREQVLTAIGFLQSFRPSERGTIDSYRLKHDAERWGDRVGLSSYISNGALIAAALYLGLPVEQYPKTYFAPSPNAKIGINRSDYKNFLKEEHRHAG